MPCWNFEYTKAVIYTVVKVGGGTGQGPVTEMAHLRLNQPPVFSSADYLFVILNLKIPNSPSHKALMLQTTYSFMPECLC